MPRAYQIPVPSEPTVVHLPTPRIKILPGLHRPFIPLFESVIAKPRLVLVLQVLLGSLEIMLIHTVLDLAKDFLRLLRIRREEFADLVDRAESMAAVQCKDRLRKRIISDVLYPRCAVADELYARHRAVSRSQSRLAQPRTHPVRVRGNHVLPRRRRNHWAVVLAPYAVVNRHHPDINVAPSRRIAVASLYALKVFLRARRTCTIRRNDHCCLRASALPSTSRRRSQVDLRRSRALIFRLAPPQSHFADLRSGDIDSPGPRNRLGSLERAPVASFARNLDLASLRTASDPPDKTGSLLVLDYVPPDDSDLTEPRQNGLRAHSARAFYRMKQRASMEELPEEVDQCPAHLDLKSLLRFFRHDARLRVAFLRKNLLKIRELGCRHHK